MPPERWAGFALVWLALSLLTWDALRTARRNRVLALKLLATAAAAPASTTPDLTTPDPTATDPTATTTTTATPQDPAQQKVT